MAELSTLARPYARAAFEWARDRGQLPGWSEQLRLAAAVSQSEAVAKVLRKPSLTARQQAQILNDVCGDSLDAGARNFVSLLASNKRLSLLPEIWARFERYKARREKTQEVTVYAAFDVAEDARQALVQALQNKLEREVSVDTQIDKELLGGVLIRADDLVIDGSVRGRLNKLAEALNSWAF